MINLRRNCLTIFQSGFRILHSASRIGEFWCITFFLLIFGIITFFNLSHSSGYMVTSHYGFKLYLSINDFKHLFMNRPVIYFLKYRSVEVFFRLFLNYVLFFFLLTYSSLYFLDTSPLSEVQMVNIFAQFVVCLFIFLIVSFDMQRF